MAMSQMLRKLIGKLFNFPTVYQIDMLFFLCGKVSNYTLAIINVSYNMRKDMYFIFLIKEWKTFGTQRHTNCGE